jgi:hypothetical protein
MQYICVTLLWSVRLDQLCRQQLCYTVEQTHVRTYLWFGVYQQMVNRLRHLKLRSQRPQAWTTTISIWNCRFFLFRYFTFLNLVYLFYFTFLTLLKLFGTEINLKNSMNVLGAIFDSKLQCSQQISNAIIKSNCAVFAIKLINSYNNPHPLYCPQFLFTSILQLWNLAHSVINPILQKSFVRWLGRWVDGVLAILRDFLAQSKTYIYKH